MLSLRARFFRGFLRLCVKPALNDRSSVGWQRGYLALVSAFILKPFGVRREPFDAEGLRGEWISLGTARDDRVLLYLHGGAYVIGSPATHRGLTTRLSRACNARVLALDYRLAPEHPYPAAVDDAVSAYRYLRKQGYAPEHIAIAGDSAGGGLTVATLMALRDAGDAMPAAAALISPWVDLTLSGESISRLASRDPLLQAGWVKRMGASYAAGQDLRAPRLSPIFADLKGLPPLLIHVGSDEILLDDSRRLETVARKAGVEVRLEIWKDLWHVWQLFAGQFPEATRAVREIGSFINGRFAD